MRETTALVRAPAVGGTVQITGVGEVLALAKHLARAKGFVPKHLLGEEGSIAAAILMGLELGLGPLEAMRSIHVIEGRPSMSAELMLGRAIRAGVRVTWLQLDAKAAAVKLERAGHPTLQRFAFTMEDAQTAGLAGRGPWKSYPAAMLRARCISAALRAYCPDVLGGGIYTPEEMGAEVGEDGEPVIDVASEPVREPAQLPPPPSSNGGRLLSSVTNYEDALEWLRERAGNTSLHSGKGRERVDREIARIVGDAPPSELAAIRAQVDEALGLEQPEQGGESDGE